MPRESSTRNLRPTNPDSSATAAATAASAATQSALLSFDPAAIVNGIVYHVLDEGMAKNVGRDSVARATRRLEHDDVRLTVQREHWEAMSNPDRLQWLLKSSGTGLTLSGGAAELGSARK